MSKVFITGDTHVPIDISKLSTANFPEQKELTKDDYVIICGDYGGVWSNSREELYWRRWLEEKNFTTLFIDGNHENFDMLYKLPTKEFCGGTVHVCGRGIYHLMRGQVYNIAGESFFTMGGASSHDREYRKEGESWWPQELPSDEELAAGLKALEKVNFNVDHILTHCAPTDIQYILKLTIKSPYNYYADRLTDYLENIRKTCKYKDWFFGHYHTDTPMAFGFRCVYYDIIRLI